ncbi:uncharacterized protein [Diadema antillarum]|uniref:uncharacterized protein n=1 Tax=Diadema antillarum TaxID=105358 RepID=UPI003A8A7CFB
MTPKRHIYIISIIISINFSLTNQAISSGGTEENDTETIEPGYFFAKFASKLSALNFRVGRRSNTVYNTNDHRSACPPLRDGSPEEIGPWPSRRKSTRVPVPRSQAKVAPVTARPSSLFNNSDFGNVMRSRCFGQVGFPACYSAENHGDVILRQVVADYAEFSSKWLPKCRVTKECARVAEKGRAQLPWVRSRWSRISSNRSSILVLPVCYAMDDLKELSPERMEPWWFDYCCFTGAICEPFSTMTGWGKLLIQDEDSATRVSGHLQVLHNATCPTAGENTTESGLDSCIISTITAWNVLSGPTSSKMQADALSTLVKCSPDLWVDPVKTFESLLNKLEMSEAQAVRALFESHLPARMGTTSEQVMKTHSSGPIMKPHEFEMTPRAVSGIVVVIILISLSILIGAWAVYQKVQSWRHPRNHIQYAPIFMQDDFLDGSQEVLETVGRWSRVEDLGPDSDAATEENGDAGGGGGGG